MTGGRKAIAALGFALATALTWGSLADSAPADQSRKVQRIALIPVTAPAEIYTDNNLRVVPMKVALAAQFNDSPHAIEIANQKIELARRRLGTRLTDELLKALKAEGFEAIPLQDVKRSAEDPDDVDFQSLDTQEAVLQVAFHAVGMFTAPSSNVLEPQVDAWAYVKARPDAKDWLTGDYFYYGLDANGQSDAWRISADPKYRYSGLAQIIERADEVGEGYDVAVQALAQSIAKQLRAQL